VGRGIQRPGPRPEEDEQLTPFISILGGWTFSPFSLVGDDRKRTSSAVRSRKPEEVSARFAPASRVAAKGTARQSARYCAQSISLAQYICVSIGNPGDPLLNPLAGQGEGINRVRTRASEYRLRDLNQFFDSPSRGESKEVAERVRKR
jgi:hypothetical protein